MSCIGRAAFCNLIIQQINNMQNLLPANLLLFLERETEIKRHHKNILALQGTSFLSNKTMLKRCIFNVSLLSSQDQSEQMLWHFS